MKMGKMSGNLADQICEEILDFTPEMCGSESLYRKYNLLTKTIFEKKYDVDLEWDNDWLTITSLRFLCGQLSLAERNGGIQGKERVVHLLGSIAIVLNIARSYRVGEWDGLADDLYVRYDLRGYRLRKKI